MSKENPHLFVSQVDPHLAVKMEHDLKQQGFEILKPAYTLFSAKKPGISCTFYESGKLVVQGKDTESFIQFYLEPEILKTFTYGYAHLNVDRTGRIGVDESGKGDFFGPLCVAAVYAEGEGIVKLLEIGVKDSKTLSESKILEIGRKIQQSFQHHIVKINPEKYNEIYDQFKNLNRLLAWGHATCIEQLTEASGCRKVIIDQFADEGVVKKALKRKEIDLDLTQRHRAEEDLVVAAASILARKTFVEGLHHLGESYGMVLPKGASSLTIKAGWRFVQKYGQEALKKVGKMHFKTYQQIISME